MLNPFPYPLCAELPYPGDSARLFEAVADRPWAALLDSPRGPDSGRYDLIVADPVRTLTTRGGETEVRGRDHCTLSRDDPFDLVRGVLDPTPGDAGTLPFAGGALGYFAYDLGRRIERLPSLARDAEDFPEMAVGIYDWAVVVDRRERRCWLAGYGHDGRTRERWGELVDLFSNPPAAAGRSPFRVLGAVGSNMSRERYAALVRRILDYIRAGDCYQVNLAQRFSARAEGDPWLFYRRLREANPAPHSAYLNFPWGQVLSASPERFLQVHRGQVETRPIKGTRPRAADPRQDQWLLADLGASAKDRAENLMIVDLLRNDLGKSCAVGSVKVPELFRVESFASVHHLVSTVTGTLAPGCDALHLLRGCFPGGSITGAPKLRAMEIIEELEPHRRGVYCGAIGYVGFDGGMDTSIAIRTLVYSHGEIRFWAGGGIVADSQVDAEYQETFDKAAVMLKLMVEHAAEPACHP